MTETILRLDSVDVIAHGDRDRQTVFYSDRLTSGQRDMLAPHLQLALSGREPGARTMTIPRDGAAAMETTPWLEDDLV